MICAKKFLTQLFALTFELNSVAVGLKLHFFVLVDNILKVKSLFIDFFHPFLSQFGAHLKNQFVFLYQGSDHIFVFLANFADFVYGSCAIRLVNFDSTRRTVDANSPPAPFALVFLVN